MGVTLFAAAFSVMMLGMVCLVLTSVRSLPVVKAGKVTKLCSRTGRVLGHMPDRIRVNGVTVDLSGDEKMLVCGDSMKDYRISNGQRIYVKRYNGSEKLAIKKYPILVLHIADNPVPDDAQFKLRKFVGYVRSADWDSVYASLKDRIRIPKNDFISQCSVKFSRMPETERVNLILSETFDEDRGTIVYSLHPASAIFGKVEYAC